MTYIKHALFALALISNFYLNTPCYASIQLSPLINDGAVLQRDEPTPIWGWTLPKTEVAVRLGALSKTVISDDSGYWRAVFPAKSAGERTELEVETDTHKLSAQDLIYGDLWLCGGQSNMEWPLRNSLGGPEEINSQNNPLLRHFKVPKSWSISPASRLANGQWQSASKNSFGDFSAVGYFFGKRIFQETKIPIGLIGSNWGGANIESWMSSKALGEPEETSRARIEKLNKKFEQERQGIKHLLSHWPNALSDRYDNAKAQWHKPGLDTSDWLSMNLPALWESQGLSNVDGVIWFRREFNLSPEQASSDIKLSLARIDDQDQTWVNGQLVGSSHVYDQVREYHVASKFLKAGINVIAVRVLDTGGGGGIYSDTALLHIEFSNGRKQSLAGTWQYKADRVTLSNQSNMNRVPTALYNKMLHPLFQTPIKGVIWYQGESNAGNIEQAQAYKNQFEQLIKDWRQGWKQPELPFYWVQLASYKTGLDTEYASPWAELRASQTAVLNLPHTGQAITLDVGDADDIHPRDKRSVGHRLANIALNKTYGQHQIPFRGPHFKKIKIATNKIIIEFNSATPLVTREQTLLSGFELVDAQQNVRAVTAKIKGRQVIIDVSDAKLIEQVRYAWSDNPEAANLQDENGLPAEPFQHSVTKNKGSL